MDPITVAIIEALSQLAKDSVKDAYEALKAAIAKKCGVNSDLATTLEELQRNPNSAQSKKKALDKKVTEAKIGDDKAIIDKLNALQSALKQPMNTATTQQAAGANAKQTSHAETNNGQSIKVDVKGGSSVTIGLPAPKEPESPRRQTNFKMWPAIAIGAVIILGLGVAIGHFVRDSSPGVAVTPTLALTSTPIVSSSVPTATTASVPAASLIGLRYMRNVYDRRLVDLRTASQQGIRVDANSQLQISDLVVSTSKIDPKYSVQIEAYADNEYIGHATSKPMTADRIQWDTIEPDKYIDGDNPTTTWIVQPSWQNLRLAAVTYLEGKAISENWTTIKLVRQADVGTSWMYDPSYIKLASLIYQVNNGPELTLDMRDAIGLHQGIIVKAGDQLSLQEVWYNATTNGVPQTIQFEALLLDGAGGFDSKNFRNAPEEDIQAGMHKLSNFRPITWTVAPDRKFLEVKFLRGDQAIFDPLMIPLDPTGNSGLIPESDAVLWPHNLVRYTDFETPADLAGWEGDIEISDAQAFTGRHTLAITVPAGTTSGVLANWRWEPPLQAEAVVGQVYWPEQPGANVAYAQICYQQCASIPIQRGHWHTFVMDLSELSYADKQLNEQSVPRIWIQAQVDKADETSYTFYVDGLQVFYPDSQ
jgi:hypothetical protein